MKKYNNIIVPTDGSVNSKRALEHAVVIASSLGATITLVYVANIVSVISNFDQIPNASGYVTEQKGKAYWMILPRPFRKISKSKVSLKSVPRVRLYCLLPKNTMPISS